MCVQLWTITLSATGLILDMTGVFLLFKSIGSGLKPIRTVNFGMFQQGFFGFGVANVEQKAIIDMQAEINKIIEETNEANRITHIKSYRWLYMIIGGFFLQLVSYVISFVSLF